MKDFTLEYWTDDGWLLGRIKEIPSVFSQGENLEELEENIRDAYRLMMEDQRPLVMNIQERLSCQPACDAPIESFGLTPTEARETRSRLKAFAPDWDSPDMDAYDHYDDAGKTLETR